MSPPPWATSAQSLSPLAGSSVVRRASTLSMIQEVSQRADLRAAAYHGLPYQPGTAGTLVVLL
jgi:hypothetical protein